MPVSIAASPRRYGVDAEDLMYKLSTSDTITSSYKYVVQVLVNGTQVAKYYLTPNPSNVAFFNLSGAVRDLCRVDDSTQLGDNIHNGIVVFSKATNGVKYVQVQAGNYNGTTETLNQSNALVYLVDGYRSVSEGLWGSWSDYVSNGNTKKVWLTTRTPSNGRITVESDESEYGVVAHLNDTTFGSAGVSIRYALYNGSTALGTHTFSMGAGTNSQTPSTGTTEGKLQYFGLYPMNIVAALAQQSVTGINPLRSQNPWTHYDLVFWNTISTPVSIPLRVVYTPYQCKHEKVQLGWANGLGGWDYITFDGRKQGSVNTTSKTYWTETGTWAAANYTRSTYGAQKKVYGVMANESYNLRTYLPSANAYRLMQSLYQSDQVMARIEGTWYPVTLSAAANNWHTEPIAKMQEVTVGITFANSTLC